MEVSIKLTVFFEDAFWVGVFEKVSGGKYEVSKIVFGSEPKDYEVFDFVLKNFYDLKFSNSLLIDEFKDKMVKPKRLQRIIQKETEKSGVGTKAQLAMKLQHETNRLEKRKNSREKNEQVKERQFELRQQNKKQKHKGH